LRLILAEHERQLLALAVGVGDERTAATMRVHVADLESGRRVAVRASDVGLPNDEGLVVLEADGSITALSEAPSRARVGAFQVPLSGRR
jgi:hypothetical protein